MGSKNNRNRNSTARLTTNKIPQKKVSNSDADVRVTPTIMSEHKVSPSPGSTKTVEAVEKVTKSSDPQVLKIVKTVAGLLQSFALLAAIAAIPIAYKQGKVQLSHNQFEEKQRAGEMALALGAYWEERLDEGTRYRARRFMNTLKRLKSSPERQNAFLSAFFDGENDPDIVEENEDLKNLLNLGHSPAENNKSKNDVTVELSNYRSALVRLLNTMEMIAIVKKYTKDSDAQNVLDYAYVSSIKQPFIRKYQDIDKDTRDVPAWYLLDEMIRELRGLPSSGLVQP
jgi:hypothetical protein